MVLYLQLFLALLNVVWNVVDFFENVSFLCLFFFFVFSVIGLVALLWVQTVWVLYKLYKQSAMHHEREVSASASSVYPSVTSSKPLDSAKTTTAVTPAPRMVLELEIVDIIAEPIGFEAFMNHLAKEVCALRMCMHSNLIDM